MNINFTQKELDVIAKFVPNMTAEELINKVLRDWFAVTLDTYYQKDKTSTEKVDEILKVK